MSEFDAFYERHIRLVYAMALAQGLERCLAEDLTQETLLRAWRHFGLLTTMEPMAQRAWLVRVLRNRASDTWRRAHLSSAGSAIDAEPQPSSVERAALRLDVARTLATLPALEREVVVLRYFMEMNSREIGEALQMPEGTVRRKLSECRRHLAGLLSQWQSEGEKG